MSAMRTVPFSPTNSAALPPETSTHASGELSKVKRGWTDVAYGALAPGVFAVVDRLARRNGASAAELAERAGDVPSASGPLLWLHGASAGEMTAAGVLVAALRAAGFAFTAGYTTTNRAGVATARSVARDGDMVALAPWDVARALARVFDRWRPRALLLIETELWPAMVREATARDVPVFSVSARMYPGDEGRYRLVRPFIAPTLRRLTRVFAQNEIERARFVRLGADRDRCIVAGDLKHAATAAPDDERGLRLRAELGIAADDTVVVCGSVHADEIPLLMAALHSVGEDVRIVVAPRHADAIAPLVTAAERAGWSVHRRSDGSAPSAARLLIWDTYGELPRAYAIATVAIVGGSFAPHGGHNLFESIRAGAPTLFGPYTDHCRDDAERLLSVYADARVAGGSVDLATRLAALLSDASLRRALWRRQRGAVPDGDGIAKQYVAMLSPWLQRVGLERA